MIPKDPEGRPKNKMRHALSPIAPHAMPISNPDMQYVLQLLGAGRQSPSSVELVWRLYNRFPKNQTRLRRVLSSVTRLAMRRRHSILPPRTEFVSTVDYYEAAMPLFIARARFEHYTLAARNMRSLKLAISTLLPQKLF